ncbi:hypothetical protein JR316_0000766 [Psilocybe cubensis]|uniref:Uncharacterized protein n=2 Tax=Psilocybe cubensis TaxID=181762 RepID=A0A8H7Y7G2_PSICU|nr:hypothetical protein JR316_0000766 [Psilocybe cubensis]KAH9486701.1 hypothetical protein JR316_0000766 [Psilocybe cubensis]
MPSQPPPEQPKILEPEVNALAHCLKDTVVNTAQVYGFYANTRKLGGNANAQSPPRSMTAALGRSVERYDQLCDSIEARIKRAINILERDLRREEERIEAEKRRKQTEALMLPPPLPTQPSEQMEETSSTQATTEETGTNPRNSPVSTLPGRRPSAISISSLQRPFPLKLDLSSTSMRISEEEAAMFQKGLASPVTLAPKSARAMGPNEFPPELMAAFNEGTSSLNVPHDTIDLTMPDNIQPKPQLSSLTVGLGDSSDKPIELDLDSMDMEMPDFNTVGMNETVEENEGDGLFSPLEGHNEGDGADNSKGDTTIPAYDMDSKVDQELFGDFSSNTGDMDTDGSMPQAHSNDLPLPADLLAQFSAGQGTSPSLQAGAETFDMNAMNTLDLSNLTSQFYGQGQDGDMNFSMDMDSFLNMGPATERQDGDPTQTQSYT